MGTRMKIVTLNCWGVPSFGSKLRPERISALAKELSKAQYDVVLLQEIWCQGDYEKLCAKLLTVLPHTHYFHSGVVGSGLCVFSKHLILETHGFPFTLNGYAHKLVHCDWYGNKSIGLAKILINGVRVNVYVSHLHADYCSKKNEYRSHRVCQALQLSQVVKDTSQACDMVVLGGDFNYPPGSIGYNIITGNASLKDAWITQRRKVDDEDKGGTVDRHDNCFSSPEFQQRNFPGDRIDFLLYRNNTGYSVDCELCETTLKKVPGEIYDFSDHVGVMADFYVRKNITAMGFTQDRCSLEKDFLEAKQIIESGLLKVQSDRVFFLISAFLCVVALVFSSDGASGWSVLGCVIGVFRTVLVGVVASCLWTALIMSRTETAALTAAKKDVNNLIKSNPI